MAATRKSLSAPPPLLPGSCIGIMGGGQLGRMLALEARRMGYRTVVLDPTPESPAAQAADGHILAAVDDAKGAMELARRSDVVTLEWELIPAPVLEEISALRPLYPCSRVLAVIQDRLAQREFLKEHRFPQTAYRKVDGLAALEEAAKALGYPCLLKRRGQGYDGKGQLKLASSAALAGAEPLLATPCVLEAFVAFKQELSVILARGQDGRTAAYPVAENVHRNGILHATRAPARIPARVAREAEGLAIAVAGALGHVGVMAVEMFLGGDGGLRVNEIAPRVHNSGHFTWGACATSQFEQHLRAVCGLPLGDTRLLAPALMVNLLGDLWKDGEPRWEKALRRPELRLHLYGKAKPAPGRKMGHALLLARTGAGALRLADELLRDLAGSPRRRGPSSLPAPTGRQR